MGGGAEGAGGAGEFGGGFAFEVERDKEGGDLGFGGLAFENGLHGGLRFLFGEGAAVVNQGT